MIFWAYVLTRLFTNHKEIRIEGDEARHLKTAKTFYRMWNDSFYDFHPPLYSLLIRIVGTVIPLHMAGVVISFASSLGLYWVTAKTYAVLGLPPLSTQIALTFLTFNYTLIYFSNRIFRYQLFAFLWAMAFYYLLTHQYVYCGIFWGLTSLTCSFNGLRFFWVWLIASMVGTYSFTPLFIFFVIYLTCWIIPKILVYSNTIYHPSGIEGKLDKVNPFTIRQLLSPVYFPIVYSYYKKKQLSINLRYWHSRIMGVFGLYPVNLWITFPFVILTYFTIKGMTQSPLWLVVITIILLYPSLTFKYRPRNSVMVIPLVGYFLGKGVPQIPLEWLNLAILALLAGFLLFNRRCILTLTPKYIASITSRILKQLPHNGILAEGNIAHAIAYLSHKRVVIVTHNPDPIQATKETSLAIKEFDLHYAVFSNRWILDWDDGYPIIDYIKTFKLIKTVRENNDTYYIYEIPR